MLCIDSADGDVAGAEVHLYQLSGGENGRFEHFGPFRTDARGRAVCAQAVFTNERGNFDRWIYARVPGRLVGVTRSAKWTNRAAINPEGHVKLRASRSVEGQVTVPSGFDPTKVTVRVHALYILNRPGEFGRQSFPRNDLFPGLDTALPEIFDHHPDSMGRIRFDDVPVDGQLFLVTDADGLAEAQWTNQKNVLDQPIELTIGEESVVSGHILNPDGQPAGGVQITARLSLVGGGKSGVLTSFRTRSDDNGRFSIHGLPQTEFVLSIHDPKQRWTIRPVENLIVKPHQDPSLELKLENAVRVSGRIVDSQGKPVEGAGISAVTDSKNAGLSEAATDSAGRYELRLPSGGAHVYVNALPNGFAYPRAKQLDIKPGQADIRDFDFAIEGR